MENHENACLSTHNQHADTSQHPSHADADPNWKLPESGVSGPPINADVTVQI